MTYFESRLQTLEAVKRSNDGYKWHDVKKFPHDLPEFGIRVLAIRDSGLPYIALRKGDGFQNVNGRGFYSVLKWRYIDYPEEEDENE